MLKKLKELKPIQKIIGVILILFIIVLLATALGTRKEERVVKLTYDSTVDLSETERSTLKDDINIFKSSNDMYTMGASDTAINSIATDEAIPETYAGAVEEAPMEDYENDVATEEATTDDTATEKSSSELLEGKKIKKDYNYTIETTEFDTYTDLMEKKIEEQGGYIENQNIVSREQSDSLNLNTYTVRKADYTIRVPLNKADKFLEFVDTNDYSHITYKYSNAEDVTSQYMDTEMHIKSLKEEYKTLEKLLSQAESVTEIIEVQDRLTSINYEIQSYESNLKELKKSTDNVKFTISILEVIYYSDTVERYSSDIIESWANIFGEWLSDGVIVILLLLVSSIPILWVLFIFITLLTKRVTEIKKQNSKIIILKDKTE